MELLASIILFFVTLVAVMLAILAGCFVAGGIATFIGEVDKQRGKRSWK